jgi:hypothetical protein
MTALAIRSRGCRRLLFGVVGVLIGLLSAWTLAVLTGIAGLARYVEQHPAAAPETVTDG